PAVDDAVVDVFGHVCGAHEENVDGRVPARERQRALARLLGTEPRVGEQLDRGLAEPALRRNRDRQAVRGRCFRRSSASR
ncbi:MAG TPA: hypothetical protein VGQ15_08315, partial [Gaiellaceae bacterium]|nr:hypothetical protein [Gaiellaceae bacterium]